MNERPILFSAPMVLAILDGRKTQTRRVVKPQPTKVAGQNGHYAASYSPSGDERKEIRCGYGCFGDRLWIRETWASFGDSSTITPPMQHQCQVRYAADGKTEWRPVPNGAKGVFPASLKNRPSIHMPRWASRITLEITGVRIERLHQISESDAEDEGAGILMPQHEYLDGNPDACRQLFRILWESINGAGSWNCDPLVWVVNFRRI